MGVLSIFKDLQPGHQPECVCRYVKFDTFHPAVDRGLPVTRVISRVVLQQLLAEKCMEMAGEDVILNDQNVVDYQHEVSCCRQSLCRRGFRQSGNPEVIGALLACTMQSHLFSGQPARPVALQLQPVLWHRMFKHFVLSKSLLSDTQPYGGSVDTLHASNQLTCAGG